MMLLQTLKQKKMELALKMTSSCLLHLVMVTIFKSKSKPSKNCKNIFLCYKERCQPQKFEISFLVKAKDDIFVELLKVVDQVKDRKGLIRRKDDTMLKLCQQLDSITPQVLDLHLNGNNIEDVIIVELEQNILQHKLDSHALIVDTFKNLLAMAKANHAMILKNNLKA